jgi:putative sterol carrier protein
MRVLFERLLADGRLAGEHARLRIHISLSDPAAHILVNTRTTPPQVTFEKAVGLFDLEVAMTADTLDAIWRDSLGLREAVRTGRVRVKGNPLKATALRPLFLAARSLYPTVLREQGMTSRT